MDLPSFGKARRRLGVSLTTRHTVPEVGDKSISGMDSDEYPQDSNKVKFLSVSILHVFAYHTDPRIGLGLKLKPMGSVPNNNLHWDRVPYLMRIGFPLVLQGDI